MKRFLGALVPVCVLLAWSANATANPAPLTFPPTELVTPSFVAEARKWANAPIILLALEGRAAKTGMLPQNEIDALDQQWRAERGQADQPLITSVLANPVSSYLTRIQADSGGVFTEIFVMDANGLNLGQSAVTSDFWQGDEAKFQKTFGAGAGSVFLDDAEYHEESRTWRAQLNLTIDSAAGVSAGAITIEVNLTELERRKLADS